MSSSSRPFIRHAVMSIVLAVFLAAMLFACGRPAYACGFDAASDAGRVVADDIPAGSFEYPSGCAGPVRGLTAVGSVLMLSGAVLSPVRGRKKD